MFVSGIGFRISLCSGSTMTASSLLKKNIVKIRKILEGQHKTVERQLVKEMRATSKALQFEHAQKLLLTLRALRNIFAHKDFLAPITEAEKGIPASPDASLGGAAKDTASTLSSMIGIQRSIISIEGYDISNIQGRSPVASMVRFAVSIGTRPMWMPDKSLYRKFKMRLPETPNDFAMMREVVSRRLAHPEWPYPDLFLIDGGKGQLNAALSAIRTYALLKRMPLNSLPLVISLAKRENEIFIPGKPKSIRLAKVNDDTRNLLMHVRDEAHRFAISYYRKLHRKQFQK